MALACKLTKLSLTNIAKVFDLSVIDACGLTENDSVQTWVAACLPLLVVQIAENRSRNRAIAAVTIGEAGEFCG
jgi:hypothetical protein